jgi:hypothetical protein
VVLALMLFNGWFMLSWLSWISLSSQFVQIRLVIFFLNNVLLHVTHVSVNYFDIFCNFYVK